MTIKEQFDQVIAYSQTGIDNPQTEQLFETWEKNKKRFYQAFGDQLIWEYPEKVSFELDETAKSEKIANFLSVVYHKHLHELYDFIRTQQAGFFKNQVVEEFITENDKIITKGTKLVKAFKYFVKDSKELNELQSTASMIIQENKVEGRLCFSIHPLDYLSISESTHNWRSCHALDGEYRAGNLSYMMDNCTVICYLKSEKDTKLPHFPKSVPWNDKKWRVLLYFNQLMDICFAGRQYPFSTEQGMNWILKNCFNQLFNTRTISSFGLESCDIKWDKWSTETINNVEMNEHNFDFSNKGYIALDNGIKSIKDIVINEEGSKQFNDVLYSSCYTPMYTCLTFMDPIISQTEYFLFPTTHTAHIEVGHMTYCLRCGNAEALDEGGTMMCYDCELEHGISENSLFGTCDCCGGRMLMDDAHFLSNDNCYCNNCFEKYVEICECCGDSFRREDMRQDENGDWYCSYCYAERE